MQQVLHDVMVAVLLHKPDDPLRFIKEHFQRLREKHAHVPAL
jgi:hypothetical protein